MHTTMHTHYMCYCYQWYVVCIFYIRMCVCVCVCLCRVSRSQMVQVLWRRSNNVDKQEMDALFDVAMISSNDETSSASSAKATRRSSRKRPREQADKTEGQGTHECTS